MTRQEWMERQDWYKRWQQRVAQARNEGIMDHTKEPAALEFTPARYGYLVPIKTPAEVQSYNAEKARLGVHGGLSDPQRYEWENQYITAMRMQVEQKSAPSGSGQLDGAKN